MNDIAIINEQTSEKLSNWRRAILISASKVLAYPLQDKIQKLTDMWDRAYQFPYPTEDEMGVLPNGCLVFDVDVAGHVVHFVVWMTFGEVRIGVKMPIKLIPDTEVGKKVSYAFDGKPCSREELTGNHIIYDWIFREGFASHDHMMKSLRDEYSSSVIAWRIGEILTHIYVSVLSFIVEGNGYVVSMKKIEIPSAGVKKRFIISGDLQAYLTFLEQHGGRQLEQPSILEDGLCEIYAETNSSGSSLNVGQYRDQDHSEFNVISIE
ncbi:MAG: hypothetical protein Q8N30_04160 [Methylococcales bacterium]|nr:hypothetical protein [Methylococcales bacterium]